MEYDYAAEEPDELSIKKGDIIKDVSQFEEGWFIGTLQGKTGVFPDNFVKVLRPAEGSKVTEVGVSQKTPAEKNEVIDTSDGRPQRVLGIGLGNIFSGKPIQLKQTTINDAKKETGVSQEGSGDTAKHNSARSPVLTDRVRAKFDYYPKQPDELELLVDDVIQILDRSLPDEGWWSGKNLRTRKVGVFPDNFVVPLVNHKENEQVFPVQTSGTTALGVPTKQSISTTSSVLNGTIATDIQSGRLAPVSTSVSYATMMPNTTNEGRGNEDTKMDWRQSLSSAPSVPRSSLVPSKPGTTGTKLSSPRDASRVGAEFMADVHLSSNSVTPNDGGSVPTTTVSTHPKNAPIPNSKLYVNLDRTETLERQNLRKGTLTAMIPAGDSPSFTEDLDVCNPKLTGHGTDRPKQVGRRLPTKFGRCSTPTSEAANDMIHESEGCALEEHNSVQTSQTPRGIPTHTDLLSSMGDLTENSRSLATQRTADQSSKAQRGTPYSAQNRANRLSSSHICRSVSPVSHATGQRVPANTGHHHSHTPDGDRRSQSRVDRRWTSLKTDDARVTCRNPAPATATSSLGREPQTGSNDHVRLSEIATAKQTGVDGHRHLLPKLQAQVERLQTQYDQYVTDSKQQMKDMRQQIDQLKNANAQLRSDMIHGQRALTERVQALMNEVDDVKKQQAVDHVEHTRLRKMIMRLDAKAIMNTVENAAQYSDTQKGSRRHHPHSGGNHEEGYDYPVHGIESHSVNEHGESDQLGSDNHIGAPHIKVADATTSGAIPPLLMNKTNRSVNPPPLKTRPPCTNYRAKS